MASRYASLELDRGEEVQSEKIKQLINSLDLTKSPPRFDRVEYIDEYNSVCEDDSDEEQSCRQEDFQDENSTCVAGSTSDSIADVEGKNRYLVCQNETQNILKHGRQKGVDLDDPGCEDESVEEELSLKQEDLQGEVWEVKLTEKALKVLQSSDKRISQRIYSKIIKLAKGDWYPRNNMVKSLSPEMKLFETKIDKGARILWEIALCFSSDCSNFQSPSVEKSSKKRTHVYSQVIRIWDIVLQHDKLQGAIDKIKEAIKKGKNSAIKEKIYGSSHIDRSDGITRPEYFIPCDLGRCIEICPAADVSSSGSLIKKFHTSTLDGLWYMLENPDLEVTFPFSITELEQEIIQIKTSEPAPIIVHGRSGTGKTTCCLYRLWFHLSSYIRAIRPEGVYGHQEHIAIDFRQMYITKNPVLCSEVEKYFNGLCLSQVLTRDIILNKEKTLPNNLKAAVTRKCFPLFVTLKMVLLMLDLSLPKPQFFERNEDGTLKEKVYGWGENTCLVEEETECINNKSKNQKEITYEVFLHEIWPLMTKRKRSPYSPVLVWVEICSFIIGSRQALVSDRGFLSKSEYSDLGKKEAPNFVGNRDQMYDYFLAYHKIKREKKYFDSGDIVLNLYQRLKQCPHGNNWKLHEIYVDETQDFSQSELLLLLNVCENPNDIFLTGDTAQCIMRGISFRFEDLRRLFYIENEHLKQTSKNKVRVPKLFPLSTNYRSHSGILDLAASVIDLMKNFFPTSFDALERDHGFFSGSKPVIIQVSSFSDLASLLTGKKYNSGDIKFGASQVILVANEDIKKALPKELPKGLAHTIFEAKGLEFNDVLLYNSFSYSKDKDLWRIVSHYLNNLMDTDHSFEANNLEPERPRPLKFDPVKHKLLNSELKYLYTAVTRARFKLWIFDEDETARKPMFEYLRVLNLVQTLTEKDVEGGKDSFVKESSCSEWEKQGNVYYKERMYSSAAHCYGKAGHLTKQKVASALDQIQRLSPEMYDYLPLAENFLEGNMIQEALACLRNARKPLLVGKLLEKDRKIEEALSIYRKHGMKEEILRISLQQEGEEKAIDIMLSLNIYDQAAERCRQDVEQLQGSLNHLFVEKKDILSSICETGAKFYHNLKDDTKMKYVLDRHPRHDTAAMLLVQLESKTKLKSLLDDGMHLLDPIQRFERHISYLSSTVHGSFSNTGDFNVELLQIQVVIALCLMMSHSRQSILLPSSYVELINFWEDVFKLENVYPSLFHCVQNHEMRRQDAKVFGHCMDSLVSIIIEGDFGYGVVFNFEASKFISSKSIVDCKSVIPAAMVLVLNMLQEGNNNNYKGSSTMLLNFCSGYDKKSLSVYMIQILLGLSNVKTKLDLYQIFVEFLEPKGEKLISCKWNKRNKLVTREDLIPSQKDKLEKELITTEGCQTENRTELPRLRPTRQLPGDFHTPRDINEALPEIPKKPKEKKKTKIKRTNPRKKQQSEIPINPISPIAILMNVILIVVCAIILCMFYTLGFLNSLCIMCYIAVFLVVTLLLH